MFGLSMTEILLLMFLGVLLFGKRLPEVGRQVGKTLMELRRGYNNLQQSLETGNLLNFTEEPPAAPPPPPARPPQRIQPTGRKFEDGPSSPSSPIV